MKLADILSCPTGYDRIQYPTIAHIAVAEDTVAGFEDAVGGNPRIRVLEREVVGDVMILRVGCPSNATRLKLLALMDIDARANF